MFSEAEFDRDLFRGTADCYDRCRLPYPKRMVDELIDWTQPSGHGRLLDLACGTGQIAFAMADRFGDVWAVDQEPEMIEVVRAKAGASGDGRFRAVVSRAEDLDAPAGGFELVAIGNAFHRLRRDAVAANAFRWLQVGGCFALLWSRGPWTGEADWQRALSALLESWRLRTGAEGRVPAGWNRARFERPDSTVLAEAGFQLIRSARFPTVHEWTVDALIGLVYSTSFLPRPVLGSQAEAFERDLRRELAEHATGGTLRETIDFAYELARR